MGEDENSNTRSSVKRTESVIRKDNSTSEADLKRVIDFLKEKFPTSVVKDQHKDFLHLHIPDTRVQWHQLFGTMLEAKTKFPYIQDYSLSETILTMSDELYGRFFEAFEEVQVEM